MKLSADNQGKNLSIADCGVHKKTSRMGGFFIFLKKLQSFSRFCAFNSGAQLFRLGRQF